MNKNTLLALAREHAPCYLYEYDVLRRQTELLQQTFPQYDLLYSVKANPFPPVVRALAELGLGADVASANEVLLSRRCGMAAEDIFFSAAGKSDAALETAWGDCALIADSLGEVARIGALCRRKGERRAIGVRLNPSFGMGGSQGGPGKFGINEEDLPRLKALLHTLPVTVEGIHVHLKSQNLDADVLGGCYRDSWALAKRVQTALECTLRYVNFGSGVGVAYDPQFEQPMELARLRTYTDAIAADNAATIKARLMIETGRFPTAQAGTYWLKVVDKKYSRGKCYVITENCMNGLQKPALAAMLRHAVPEGALTPYEPLFTSEWAFPIIAHGDESATETVDIVGNLCCAADVLAEGFTGPRLEVGDLIEVRNAGAYACTLTAQRFSSHRPPQELLVYDDGHTIEE